MLAPVRRFVFDRLPVGTRVRDNLRASAIDGVFYGGMVGIGETYLAAFALALGMSEVASGLVASLPMVAGGAMQLISIRAVRWLGSEKAWIVTGATIQALSFLPLIFAAVTGSLSPAVLVVIGSIYWGAGLATGPAWNTWIETIVPTGVRTGFFAIRSRCAQLATLGGFLLGGVLLSAGESAGSELLAYATIFLLAAISRLVSVYWLALHRPIERPVRAARHFPSVASDGSSTAKVAMRGGRLLVFMVVLQGMVQIAGPYFTPYMLRELNFSYVQFVALIAISFVAKAISFSAWASLSKRSNSRRLLWIGAIGLTPVSALWIVSQNFVWLMVAQLVSGIVWAAYELGFFLTFFEVLPRDKRIRMLTIYNLGNTVAIALGALVGGAVLHRMGPNESTYWTLFGLSAAGRLISLGILFSAGVVAFPVIQMGVRVLSLRVGSASLDTPVLPSFDESEVAQPSQAGDMEAAESG